MASDLSAIRIKVRRITRSPSISQITTADIDEYINTFILYDFPEELRLFSFRTTLNFYTQPNKDVYTGTDIGININTITNIFEPIYLAGFEGFYSQSRTEFFRIYPFNNSVTDTGLRGDGVTTAFTGILPNGLGPYLQNNVTFSSIDANNNGLALADIPFNSQSGNLLVPPLPAVAPIVLDPVNNINYLTGAFSLTFGTAPALNQPINSAVVPYSAARPDSMLFFDNKFTIRPVPDDVYQINLEYDMRPTALLTMGQSPELEQWWQYIAYGASKKVFEDRMDLDSIAQIMPELKRQERLVLRRTIVQQTNERVATIYTDQTAGAFGSGFFSGGGSF